MFEFEFSERAAQDVAAAQSWYDGRGTGLGDRFVDALVKTIGAIQFWLYGIPDNQLVVDSFNFNQQGSVFAYGLQGQDVLKNHL